MARLDEIPGVGTTAARAIIAQVRLDMSRFPTLPTWPLYWAAPVQAEQATHLLSRAGQTYDSTVKHVNQDDATSKAMRRRRCGRSWNSCASG